MQTEYTFTWGDATITVRRARVRDRLAEDAAQTKLTTKEDEVNLKVTVRQFAKICSQSTVVGDVGFALVPATAPEPELRDAFEAWLDADLELMDKWFAALNIVDAPLTPQKAPDPKPKASRAK